MSVAFDTALRYYLTHTSSITALASTRVYRFGEVPAQADHPFVTFRRIANDPVGHLGGRSTLTNARYQVDAVSTDNDQAQDLSAALVAALDGYRGDMGQAGATVAVRGIEHDSEADDFTPPPDASETGEHVIPLVFSIWHVTS